MLNLSQYSLALASPVTDCQTLSGQILGDEPGQGIDGYGEKRLLAKEGFTTSVFLKRTLNSYTFYMYCTLKYKCGFIYMADSRL